MLLNTDKDKIKAKKIILKGRFTLRKYFIGECFMKFKAIRKLTLIAAVAAISTVICGISASAFVEGYENAT